MARLPTAEAVGDGGQAQLLPLYMFYTYVLQSSKDGKLYIGYTDNLLRRCKEHNNGLVKATRSRTPLKLVYYEACLKKEKAIKREKYFKTGYGRKFLKERI